MGSTTLLPGFVLAGALGLALAGCVDKDEGGNADTGGVASEGTATSGATEGPGMTSDPSAASTGVDDFTDGGGYDYDGAPPDWTVTSSGDGTTSTPDTDGGSGTGGSDTDGTDTDGTDTGGSGTSGTTSGDG